MHTPAAVRAVFDRGSQEPRSPLRRSLSVVPISAIATLALLAGLVGFVLIERTNVNADVAKLFRVQALTGKARELSLYVQYNAHDTNAYTLGHLEHRREYAEHAGRFRRTFGEIERNLANIDLGRKTELALAPIGPLRERYDRASNRLFRAADQNRRAPTSDNQAREDAAWKSTDELRWTPLSSVRLGLVSFGSVMAALLEPGGRRDGNDNWSL